MKIRCSALGKIMTSSRTKGDVLSQTAKTYIEDLVKEHVFGIKKEFKSRYTDKGIQQEDIAIEMASRVLNLPFALKNEQYFENDFIKGTPDLILEDEIIDIKCPFSGSTFPWFETELPNNDYYWQMVGYCWLTGKTKARVVYCLVDTPEDIILSEIQRTSWNKLEISVSDETEEEVRFQHEFERIDENKRIRTYLVELTDEDIAKVTERVLEANKYYNELIDRL
jgi:hypothetical protein